MFDIDLESTLTVRSPFNTMKGVFILYKADESEIESQITISRKENSDLTSSLSVRTLRENDFSSSIFIMYRENEYLDATIEIIGSTYLESYLEVRPNNRMFGIFEILDPPRVNKLIPPVEDAVTRSREDLVTINYGDMKRMMIGKDSLTSEYFESFIKFDQIANIMPDLLLLEKANLRLYYSGDFVEGTNIELYLPNARWTEYGITHANKPLPIEFITNEYIVNKNGKYIEFDIKEVVLRWKNNDIYNFGLLIKSNDNHSISFYTRESEKPPALNVQYITNVVYSIGRSELESTVFIWGIGHAELSSSIEVHSDWGFKELEATMYVHRPEVPLEYDVESTITITKPDLDSTLIIAKRKYDDIQAYLSVREIGEKPLNSKVSVNKPELISVLTVDPNTTLKSYLLVARTENEYKESLINVSRPDLNSVLTVDPNISLESFVYIQKYEHDEISATLTVSRPELNSFLTVKALGSDELESVIEIPYYEYLDSQLGISRPDLTGFIDIHTIEEKEATLYVKHREHLDSSVTIKQISELVGIIDIIFKEEKEAKIAISRPELYGYIYPRVAGENDIETLLYIRQRDVSDLDSFITVGGVYGAYYFII